VQDLQQKVKESDALQQQTLAALEQVKDHGALRQTIATLEQNDATLRQTNAALEQQVKHYDSLQQTVAALEQANASLQQQVND
jgi:hypothetical protein